jgi:hypothetical protein
MTTEVERPAGLGRYCLREMQMEHVTHIAFMECLGALLLRKLRRPTIPADVAAGIPADELAATGFGRDHQPTHSTEIICSSARRAILRAHKALMLGSSHHVRLTPESGHVQCTSPCCYGPKADSCTAANTRTTTSRDPVTQGVKASIGPAAFLPRCQTA